MELGQNYIVGFYGTEYNNEIDALLKDYRVGGFILFKRNMPDKKDTLKRLIATIYDKAAQYGVPKPFITIDHEGGRVHRLENLSTHFPPPGALSFLPDDKISQIYAQQARELRYFGFNMTLGPVLDLCPSTGTKSHIGARAFSMDVATVCRQGNLAMIAMEEVGVLTTPKHFPGYGIAELDPHYHLPANNASLEELEKGYLAPFRAAIEAGTSIIMSAHILNKLVDPKWPATLSKTWLDYLKNNMKFNGLILSDDLCMKSIWDMHPVEEYTLRGVESGQNILLICHTTGEFEGSFHKSYQALEKRAKENDDFLQLVKTSIDKVTALKNTRLSNFKPHDDDKVFQDGAALMVDYWKMFSSRG